MFEARPKTDQFVLGGDERGVFVRGVSAVLNHNGEHVALVAPDVDKLERLWDTLTDFPLDRARVQQVGIYSKDKPGVES